jgi:hypothetical protein
MNMQVSTGIKNAFKQGINKKIRLDHNLHRLPETSSFKWLGYTVLSCPIWCGPGSSSNHFKAK